MYTRTSVHILPSERWRENTEVAYSHSVSTLLLIQL